MNGPITNFELGKIRHSELEAEVGRHQSEQAVKADGQSSLTKLKLALTMTGATVALYLIGQVFPI